jgi:NADP-dependent 3-hydroxy acid dehydrogenase YdfG
VNNPGAILITGCSSGIGRAAAEYLAARGHTVYATARRLDAIAELQRAGCRTLALDVLQEDSMRAAVAAVEAEHGAVGTLVNLSSVAGRVTMPGAGPYAASCRCCGGARRPRLRRVLAHADQASGLGRIAAGRAH